MALDTSSASAGIRPGVRPDGRRQDGSTAAALHLALDGDHSRPHVTRVSTASPAHPHSTPSYASNAAGVHQEPDRAGQKTHMNPSSAPHGLTAVPAKGAILAGEMPAVVQGKPILELLQQFLALHHQRAQHYARLHLGFRRFLENKLEGQYKALLQELTGAFSQCSLQARVVQAELLQRQREDLASIIEDIQGQERTKLQLTLSLQALKQAGAAGAFSWQKAPPAEGIGPLGSRAALAGWSQHFDDESDPLGQQEEGCDHHHGHAHSYHHACYEGGAGAGTGTPPPPEPTAEEYHCALQESIQSLDRCVAAINDSLDEIKYAMEDLEEGQC